MTEGTGRSIYEAFATERLVIRTFEDTDADMELYFGLFTLEVEALGAPWLLLPPSQGRLAANIKKFKDNQLLRTFICLREQNEGSKVPKAGTPIGYLAMTIPSMERRLSQREVEMAIILHDDYQGKGYGPEALKWAVDWTFRSTTIHRVMLRSAEWNSYAPRAWEKVGFVREGRAREAAWHEGRFWDVISWSMLEHEWDVSKGALRHKETKLVANE